MALIRLKDKVPPIYVDKSRDFQLLCRLYDVLLNGVKYDTDGIQRLISSKDCNSNVLQLLQTKLGFFTDKEFTDTTLRYILQCFPLLVKKKGTRAAIEQAVFAFLKINGLKTTVKVDIITTKPTDEQTSLYGLKVTDHSVVIGIESSVRDVTPLREMLKYIIPCGYNLFFYFFVGQETEDKVTHIGEARLVLISNDVNGMAGSVPIVKKGDTYKDWLDTIKITLLSKVTQSNIITCSEDIKSQTDIYGTINNYTTGDYCQIVDIQPITVKGNSAFAITLNKAVTWKTTDNISYVQNWYTDTLEQDEIASVNTIEAESTYSYDQTTVKDATGVLGDIKTFTDSTSN